MGGLQQRSFPPTASSACHTSPLDNHPNAGRNKWDADPITATVLFLFVLTESLPFRKEHIPKKAHFVLIIFTFDYIIKRAHSIWSTFEKGHIPC